MVVVDNLYGEQVFLKKPGEEVVKVNMGHELYSSAPRIASGLNLSYNTLASDLEGVTYSSIRSGVLEDMDGERERVLSKARTVAFADGYLFYLTEDHDLYYAKADGAELSDETRLAGDVYTLSVSLDGKYVYYMRNCEDNTGTLYCYKPGEQEAVKVSGNVACESGSTTYAILQYGRSGDTIFYWKNVEETGDTDCGTLYVWKYGDEEGTKVASEVIVRSLDSGLYPNAILPDAFFFFKYAAEIDDETYADILFYNGTETSRIASEVRYDG